MNYTKLKYQLYHLGIIGYIFGLFLIDVVRILPSLSMVLICVLALTEIPNAASSFKLNNGKPYLFLAASFLIVLPSGLYSSNTAYFLERIQILLPFLLLPLAFWGLPKLSVQQFNNYLLLFGSLCFLVCAEAFIYYIFHQKEVNQLYLESKVMPSLVSHHPTFSMMIAMAIYACYYLYLNQEESSRHLKKILLFIGVGLFIFLHIYSVRSGLLALYVLIFWELIQFIFIKKQTKKAIIGLAIIIGIGALTLALSPTVRNKITNTNQDLEVVKSNGSAKNQSLASRLVSYKNAFQIASNNSIFLGCGLGDIEDQSNLIYKTQYPEIEKKILPHNQFLFYYAALGLLGIILFMLTFYGSLFVKFSNKNSILIVQYILLSVFFMVEAPLENQLGVGFSLLFILLPNQLNKEIGNS